MNLAKEMITDSGKDWEEKGSSNIQRLKEEGENNNNNLYNIKLFKLLGYIVGRAIFDEKSLDIPLNKIFWDRVLERGVVFESLKYIDENLYKTIFYFFELPN